MKQENAAVGFCEFSSIARGMCALDDVAKNSGVQILQGDMVCPGKFMLIFAGQYAEVWLASQTIAENYASCVLFNQVIGNLSPAILDIASARPASDRIGALGILELKHALLAVQAADEAIKTAHVHVESLRLANGIGGKGVVVLSGGIAEVSVAVERAAAFAQMNGGLIGQAVITNPGADSIKALTKCSFVGGNKSNV